ncbi:hypothetical protein [Paenirhodobacter sp.]|uniref:hypothetical protein n=1 Tax=Paenirhodobacter sp. TaxID=1965326 RepID=UPI003B407858
MQIFADALMGMATLGAAIYCFVLSRRLKRFNQLESGMGGAIAVLSAQVDDMTKALNRAQATAAGSAQQLGAVTERAEQAAQRLEIMLASLHDLSDEDAEARRHRTVRRRARPANVEAAE